MAKVGVVAVWPSIHAWTNAMLCRSALSRCGEHRAERVDAGALSGSRRVDTTSLTVKFAVKFRLNAQTPAADRRHAPQDKLRMLLVWQGRSSSASGLGYYDFNESDAGFNYRAASGREYWVIKI